MTISLHVDYPPCFVSSKFDSLAYFLCEKNGLEQIVWPCPPCNKPITLIHITSALHNVLWRQALFALQAESVGQGEVGRGHPNGDSTSSCYPWLYWIFLFLFVQRGLNTPL